MQDKQSAENELNTAYSPNPVEEVDDSRVGGNCWEASNTSTNDCPIDHEMHPACNRLHVLPELGQVPRRSSLCGSGCGGCTHR